MRSRGWFGPKQFGWDVAPRSWQGWTVILLYTLVLLAIDRLSIIPHADKMIYIGLATIGTVVYTTRTSLAVHHQAIER